MNAPIIDWDPPTEPFPLIAEREQLQVANSALLEQLKEQIREKQILLREKQIAREVATHVIAQRQAEVARLDVLDHAAKELEEALNHLDVDGRTMRLICNVRRAIVAVFE